MMSHQTDEYDEGCWNNSNQWLKHLGLSKNGQKQV